MLNQYNKWLLKSINENVYCNKRINNEKKKIWRKSSENGGGVIK